MRYQNMQCQQNDVPEKTWYQKMVCQNICHRKKCAKCGIVVKEYSYVSFCESCAEKVWDSGFDSTTQHAEEIYEASLKKKKEINELLNHTPVSYKSLLNLISYKSGKFFCKKCGKLRLKWIHFGDDEKEAKLRKMLATACPKCNSTDNFKFE